MEDMFKVDRKQISLTTYIPKVQLPIMLSHTGPHFLVVCLMKSALGRLRSRMCLCAGHTNAISKPSKAQNGQIGRTLFHITRRHPKCARNWSLSRHMVHLPLHSTRLASALNLWFHFVIVLSSGSATTLFPYVQDCLGIPSRRYLSRIPFLHCSFQEE